MTHVTDYLAAYLDRQLSDSEMDRVRQHLDQCVECRSELDAIQTVHHELSTLIPLVMQDIHPPEHGRRQISRALHNQGMIRKAKEPQMSQSSATKPSWLVVGLAVAFTGIIALVFLIAIFAEKLPNEAGAPTIEPTGTPTSEPTPTLRSFELSQDDAFTRLTNIIEGQSTGDPLVNECTIEVQEGNLFIEQTQRRGLEHFVITTIRSSIDRPLPDGEEVLIHNLTVILRIEPGGTVDLSNMQSDYSIRIVDPSGSTEYPNDMQAIMGCSTKDPNLPPEITYQGGIFLVWNIDDRQHSVFTNLTLDNAVAVARTMIFDDDNLPEDRVVPQIGDPAVLTAFAGEVSSAAWSPRSNKIIFDSELGINIRALFSINVDGSGLTQLTDGAGNDSSPVWSPDGTQIAFGTMRQGDWDIYIMNSDGNEQRPLVSGPNYDGGTVWSPDGSRIAFFSDRNAQRNIYVIDVDGSNLTQLTTGPGHLQDLVWSPDGTHIAYVVWDENGIGDVVVMNADGSEPVLLTDHSAPSHSPAWSPDGTRIAYVSGQSEQMNIYVADMQNLSEPIRLTQCGAMNFSPVWSPDGEWIAFSTDRNGNYDLYLAAADGSGVIPLVNTNADELSPVWSPDGTKILFSSGKEHVSGWSTMLIPITFLK
ncbi:MAG: PD40 domain-containing protein [Anaerolineae bacterium]|nr:PD40 domain-containing protein [Anaerolineae bacterium]